MRLGRHSGITRRGRWLVFGFGRFGGVIGWGSWGDFKRAVPEAYER